MSELEKQPEDLTSRKLKDWACENDGWIIRTGTELQIERLRDKCVELEKRIIKLEEVKK